MTIHKFLQPRILIAALALVLVAGFLSDYLVKWGSSARHVLAWVQSEPSINRRFGDVDSAAIVKQTDYRNAATGLHERRYEILIKGSAAQGQITVIDNKPDSGHHYRFKGRE